MPRLGTGLPKEGDDGLAQMAKWGSGDHVAQGNQGNAAKKGLWSGLWSLGLQLMLRVVPREQGLALQHLRDTVGTLSHTLLSVLREQATSLCKDAAYRPSSQHEGNRITS